jgi:AraC-like DNA-binding protein
VDPLSDVLAALRLSSAVLFRAELAGPWCFSIPHAREMSVSILPDAARLVRFHIVTEGECLVIIGDRCVGVAAGQVFLLPHGDAHLIGSAANLPPIPVLSVLPAMRPDDPPASLSNRGRGPRTTLLCGFLGCDDPIFEPLFSTLPSIIVENGTSSWLERMLDYASHEGLPRGVPGGHAMSARMVELMFVEVIRRHIAELPPEETGWLAGLRDPQVGRAVAELHAAPERSWTVEILARQVGTSRSILAERFRDVVGLSPMRYLTTWRLQVACNILRHDDLSIAEAAARVGYQSEAAFHRAFKRILGEAPAAWRRRVCGA